MSQVTLDSRLDGIVGGRTATALLKAFDMHTVRDLLWHVPRRYSNRGELTPLRGLPSGEHVTVLAQVLDARARRMQRGGTLVEVRITDGEGSLKLTYFNQQWQADKLLPGKRGIFSGKVSDYRGELQLQHPEYELFEDRADAETGEQSTQIDTEQSRKLSEAAAKAFAERPVPIYPATAKLPSWTIERAVGVVLDALQPTTLVTDPLPEQVRSDVGVMPFGQALELIHRPARTNDWQRARDSLRFREAFDLQLALLHRRRTLERSASTARPLQVGGLVEQLDALLPFELTGDQQSVASTLSAELAAPHPMHRLLQGEVGSGKTVVALRAMLQVAESGGQSALLAPTEVLASQHFRSIVEALGPELVERLRPVLLTSKMPVAQRRKALLAIASGQALLAVGTHALLGEAVSFFDLGFIVVDEQHRFGVEQRETLRQKGTSPHVLMMTATPIPRTVALTAFGDLETLFIRQLPAGRQGIATFVVPMLEKPQLALRSWSRALEEIAQGRQVYVVCPAIAEGTREDDATEELAAEHAEVAVTTGLAAAAAAGGGTGAGMGAAAARPLANVEQVLAELQARPDYAGVRVAALTGAMKVDEKDSVMRAFAAGEIDVLVATTVIEVGVNVPNASMMIVLDADRFGVSQLHQLRGRVGRGEHPGLCLLMSAAPPETVARERIEAVAETSDGFVLAERDLELRREGDILGTAQSGGKSTLRLLRVAEHGEVIERARAAAGELLANDPELVGAPELAALLAGDQQQQQLQSLAKS